jgi:type II secretory pathway pseudopilin PulG
MIEMLITISIILFLFAMLVVAGGPLKQRSMRSKTEGQIQTIGILLENYKAKAGGYPKDGIDEGDKVETEDGTRLQSGAALTFALVNPVKVLKRQANGELKVMGEEDAVGEFKDTEFGPAYLGDPQARELLDGFDEPFHYDRLAGGTATYSRQEDGDVHLGWDEQDLIHGDDPREKAGLAVASAGLQNVGRYDVWSHGPDGHTKDEKPEAVIANWRVPGPEAEKE